MKTTAFFKIVLIITIAVSFASYLSNICDDDESGPAFLCVVDNSSVNERLALSFLCEKSAFFLQEAGLSLSDSAIVYLEMHEKSPPVFPSVISA